MKWVPGEQIISRETRVQRFLTNPLKRLRGDRGLKPWIHQFIKHEHGDHPEIPMENLGPTDLLTLHVWRIDQGNDYC